MYWVLVLFQYNVKKADCHMEYMLFQKFSQSFFYQLPVTGKFPRVKNFPVFLSVVLCLEEVF